MFALFLSCVLLLLCGCQEEEVGDSSPHPSAEVEEVAEPPPLPDTSITFLDYEMFLPPGVERSDDVPENIEEAIDQGRHLMNSVRLEQKKCGGKGLGWRKCLGDFRIAAVNQDGRVQAFDLYEDTAPTHGFTVTCEREGGCGAGVNPSFRVSAPPGWTVVAIRTAVKPKNGGEEDADGAVYIPYSSRLDVPELRLAALKHLSLIGQGVYWELYAKGLTSEWLDDVLIVDVGEMNHVIALILTEQMFSDHVFASGTDAERFAMLNRTLTIIGANKGEAFRYAVSRVGARGLAQVMPSTYARLDKAYPEATLHKDRDWGRIDHYNAMKAAVLHADAELWPMTDEYRRFLLDHPEDGRLVLAAGYNANIKTVMNAIKACGEDWRKESCEKLPGETRRYLLKYEWIYGVMFDQDFRKAAYERAYLDRE